MTVSLTHSKVITNKPATANTNDVDAVDWNNEHVLTMATGNLLGRTTSGDGAVEELSPAAVRSLLNVEEGATADQTGAEIVSAVNTELGGTGWQSVQQIFDTKAHLEAATIDAGVDSVYVSGYTTAGDGGGALYKRVALEPSHSGKVQSADGAWWELVDRVVRPQMFGAVGDGSANDAAAFNAMWNMGRDVYIPRATYAIAAQTTLVNKQGIYVFAEKGAKLLRTGNAATLVLDKDCTGCVIEGLEIDSNKANFPAASSGLVVFGAFNKVRRCVVRNAPGHGIIFSNTFINPIYSVAEDCQVFDCDEIGITYPDAHYSKALFNQVQGCGLEGITIDSGTGQGADFCEVHGNTVIDCVGGVGAIGLEGSNGCRVTNNLISGGVGGIVFQNNINASTNCVVKNNHVYNTSGPGIWLKRTLDIIDGVTYNATDNTIVEGNTLANTNGVAIRVDADNVGNMIGQNIVNGQAIENLAGASTTVAAGLVAFRATRNLAASNVTGDGTNYVMVYPDEEFDRGAGYNPATGVFTAPVSGLYEFEARVQLQSSGGLANDWGLDFIRSAGTAIRFEDHFTNEPLISPHGKTGPIYMAKGSTIFVQVQVYGSALDTSVLADAAQNFFSGRLVG